MNSKTTLNFEYTRSKGERRTYQVTLGVNQDGLGEFGYEAWVHFGGEFKGNGIDAPLTAKDHQGAILEAREGIKQAIEDLSGIVE